MLRNSEISRDVSANIGIVQESRKLISRYKLSAETAGVPKKRQKATLAEVAARAGVSAMTVSRALSQPNKVKPQTLERILLVVDELGFIPNQMASALAANRSKIIGLSVPSLSNQVFIEVVSAVQDFFLPQGYQVVIHDCHYSSEQEYDGVQMFMRLQVDAIILIGVDQLSKTVASIEQSGIGVVQLMDVTESPLNINIGFSQYQAGRQIAEHFFSKGCTKLAFLGARMDSRTQRRLAGFKSLCIERGAWDEQLCVTTELKSNIGKGKDLFRELQSRGRSFDALFCCNDDLALGVMFECLRAKIEIPRQFRLAGFNNLEFAQETVPSLTSIGTSRYDMAIKACDLLMKQLMTGERRTVSLDWPMTLHVRETTQ
jgi:LacI family gluconate utilization system Gnt-I transcriptional repressor